LKWTWCGPTRNRRPDLWRDVKKIESEHKADISVRGREALEELKKDGFVILEGEYNIVGDTVTETTADER
jgi:ribosome recycling factor